MQMTIPKRDYRYVGGVKFDVVAGDAKTDWYAARAVAPVWLLSDGSPHQLCYEARAECYGASPGQAINEAVRQAFDEAVDWSLERNGFLTAWDEFTPYRSPFTAGPLGQEVVGIDLWPSSMDSPSATSIPVSVKLGGEEDVRAAFDAVRGDAEAIRKAAHIEARNVWNWKLRSSVELTATECMVKAVDGALNAVERITGLAPVSSGARPIDDIKLLRNMLMDNLREQGVSDVSTLPIVKRMIEALDAARAKRVREGTN